MDSITLCDSDAHKASCRLLSLVFSPAICTLVFALSSFAVESAEAPSAEGAITGGSSDRSKLRGISQTLVPGEWKLFALPMEAVLPLRRDIGSTTWGRSGPKAIIRTWNGAAFDPDKLKMYFHGGGQRNYGGNGVYEFDFGALEWKQLSPPYILPERSKVRPCPQPEKIAHGPRSAHTYDSLVWSNELQKMLYWNFGGYCFAGKFEDDPYRGIWVFDPRSGSWDFSPRIPASDLPDSRFKTVIGSTSTAELDDGTIVVVDKQGIHRIDPVTMSLLQQSSSGRWGVYHQLLYVGSRKELYLNGRKLIVIDPETLDIKQTLEKPADARVSVDAGMAFHERGSQLVFWEGGNDIVVYDLELEEWRWSASSSDLVPTGERPWSKWVYLPEYDMFAGISKYSDGVWFYRLPDWESLDDLPDVSLQEQVDSQPGPIIKITPDNYRLGAVVKRSDISIDGAGATVTGVVKSKGVFLIQGDRVTLKNFNISLGHGSWVNDACVRIEGANASIVDIKCSNTQMGILTGGRSGELLIDTVEISNTGINPGGDLGHAIYACSNKKCLDNDRVVVRNSKFINIGVGNAGHVIKSRAPNTLVENNMIASGNGKTGRHVELPNGGSARIAGNSFLQGPTAENSDLLSLGIERFKGPAFTADVLVEENSFTCDRKATCYVIRGEFAEGDQVLLRNNQLHGSTSPTRGRNKYVEIE